MILTGVQHPSGIPDKIVQKVVARRGRLHAFETIEPGSTSLVIIDLDVATVSRDKAEQAMIPVSIGLRVHSATWGYGGMGKVANGRHAQALRSDSRETVLLCGFLLVCVASDYVDFFGLEDCRF